MNRRSFLVSSTLAMPIAFIFKLGSEQKQVLEEYRRYNWYMDYWEKINFRKFKENDLMFRPRDNYVGKCLSDPFINNDGILSIKMRGTFIKEDNNIPS